METTCKYFKRESMTEYTPFADSKRDLAARLHDTEKYCPDCRAVVEFECKLDARGLIEICPFCNTEL